MKSNSVLLAIFLAFGISALAQTSAPVANTDDANARQARKIIDQCIQALGGQAYLSFANVKQTGRGYGFDRNGASGLGIGFTRYFALPDKERYEYLKDHSWVIIHNGDKGYETTFRGSKAEDPKDLASYNRRRLYWLETILRNWLNQKGTALFYDGPTIAETKQTEKLTIINPQNQSVTLYVDAKTFLPVKKSYSYRDPEDNQMSEQSEQFDKYRMVQGINTPFLVTRSKNDLLITQRFINSAEYNVPIPDALFAQPTLVYDPTKK